MAAEKVICQICKKEFKNRAGLAGHMVLAHGRDDEPAKKPRDTGCDHVWRKLRPAELEWSDVDGKTIRELGFKFVCNKCKDLR